MKQVIVICFMAVSLCLSDVPQGNPTVAGNPDPAVTQSTAPPPTLPAGKATNVSNNPDPSNNNKPGPTTETVASSTEKTTSQPITSTAAPVSTTANGTIPITIPSTTTTVAPSPAPKPKPEPVPDHKDEVTVKPSEPAPLQTSRGFDGGSFVGGIILTLGLLAIGFMGFKYYKNQTERNYHTL